MVLQTDTDARGDRLKAQRDNHAAQIWPKPWRVVHSNRSSGIICADGRCPISIAGNRSGAGRGQPVKWRGVSENVMLALEEATRAVNAQGDLVALTIRLAEAPRTAINVAAEIYNQDETSLSEALAGHLPGYRADIDAIHAALAEYDLPDSGRVEP